MPEDQQTPLDDNAMSGYGIKIRACNDRDDVDFISDRLPSLDGLTVVECEDLASAVVLVFRASTGEIVWENPACQDAKRYLPGALALIRVMVEDNAFQVASA